jgi:hypothetical protein
MHYFVSKSWWRRRWHVYQMSQIEGDHTWLASFANERHAVDWMNTLS